jgi:hypothetical protein
MSIRAATNEETAIAGGFLVQPPRSGDMISGALRLAFGRPDKAIDDFAALLRQIDCADHAATHG